MYIFTPEAHKPTDKRPAAVFFFGGGWRGGTPKQFEPHCKHLASRGVVAMAADYRVSSRHQTKAVACVSDAKSAVRWIRREADRLGVDGDRILAGGGSAGGHIAACTGTIEKFDESDEDLSISSKPNAMALFNPATVLAPVDGRGPFNLDRVAELTARIGVDPKEISPLHQLKPGAPPTILFHGTGDTTVKFWTAEAFATAMKEAGNRCDLQAYDGQPHGFFNYGRSRNKYYELTTKALDEFLVSLGYLSDP
jgi:acetyl esterase/lipase